MVRVSGSRLLSIVAIVFLATLVTVSVFPGFVVGQSLTEKVYYSQGFEAKSESAPQVPYQSVNLKGETSNWIPLESCGSGGNTRVKYGGEQTLRSGFSFDTSRAWLQAAWGCNKPYWRGNARGKHSIKRKLPVPDGMEQPVLVAEFAYTDSSGSAKLELSAGSSVVSSQSYSKAGSIAAFASPLSANQLDKVGSIKEGSSNPKWRTAFLPVNPSKSNVTFAMTSSGNGNRDGLITHNIRKLYFVDAANQTLTREVYGFKAQPESEQFGGPEPYKMLFLSRVYNGQPETVLHIPSEGVTRKFNLNKIASEPKRAYFESRISATGSAPVTWKIKQFGQVVASGSVQPGNTKEIATQINFKSDEFTLIIESKGPHEIHYVRFTGLVENQAANPLVAEKPIDLFGGEGGQNFLINVMSQILNLSTTTVTWVAYTATAVGALTFFISNGLGDADLRQSLMAGGMVVIFFTIAISPLLNTVAWLLTGTAERAPLSNPELEAEPPIYFSTTFGGGEKEGFEVADADGDGKADGSIRPKLTGAKTFNLELVGNPVVAAEREVEIPLADALDTSYVRYTVKAFSVSGERKADGTPHTVTVYMSVWVDGEKVVNRKQIARSFNGKTVTTSGTVSYPLDAENVRVKFIAESNINGVQAQAQIVEVKVGATSSVEGGGGEDN